MAPFSILSTLSCNICTVTEVRMNTVAMLHHLWSFRQKRHLVSLINDVPSLSPTLSYPHARSHSLSFPSGKRLEKGKNGDGDRARDWLLHRHHHRRRPDVGIGTVAIRAELHLEDRPTEDCICSPSTKRL